MPRPPKNTSALARCRWKLGLTQSSLAEILGVGREYIAKLEAKDEINEQMKARLVERIGPSVYVFFETTQTDTAQDGPRAPWQWETVESKIRLPLDFKLSAVKPTQRGVKEMAGILTTLAAMFGETSEFEVHITATHRVEPFESPTDLRDRVLIALADKHQVDIMPKDDKDRSESQRFAVSRKRSSDKPVVIEVSGLNCFPTKSALRRKKLQAKTPTGIVISVFNDPETPIPS